ncbi:alpha/beta fold hydrolase [Aquaticitalea lipolytica]|uniref:alpha/beta fold hydrolase n=1 Tax=Aquaticitalea lipolytica TaxID=1247562 RepID=UPI00166BE981|nr:alpha/beta fold hydrolase [Aquaticitalea lipolytica]
MIILISMIGLNAQDIFAQTDIKKFPATSQAISIIIESDSIAVFGMFAAGEEQKETVILTHGLPGHERNLDLAQELRRSGKNVIYFNYRGAWGSQGEFLYSNCVEDVHKILDFFSSSENVIKYKIKPNAFILFGHSMGGGIALIAGATDNRVKKIAIYSPYLLDNATEAALNGSKTYFESLFMLNINFENFKSDILRNQSRFKISNFKQELAKKQLLIFDENERNKLWIEELNNVEYILMETDHSFSDKRIELIDKAKKWID